MQGYLETGGKWGEQIRADHLAPGIAQKIIALTDAPGDRKHITRSLRHIPGRLHHAIVTAWGRTQDAAGYVAANLALLDTRDAFAGGGLDLAASDWEIIELSKKRAAEVRDLLARRTVSTSEAVRADLDRFAAAHGVAAPDAETLRGVIGRMTDAAWWRRAIRKATVRAVEAQAIGLGMVHRRASPYVSIEAIARRGEQKRRNLRMLGNTEAVREDGEAVGLDVLAAGAVSNPAIRRAELMTRISGFERCAVASGHAAMFYTATCPSRMHARYAATGEANPKYDGTTPKAAQSYLSGVWARVRAALARRGVAVYGFRVAEPHHDATPHWHMLFFMCADAVQFVTDTLRRYFCKADAAELNNVAAMDARFDAKPIDAGKGTAAGYIAKYIAKNIDGFGVGEDLETAAPAADSVNHVDAWAATWGIRQFQQIGGAGVTIWRELRRLREGPQMELFRPAWEAADAGNWQGYQDAQGGAVCKRADRPLALWREYLTRVNQYGEETAGALSGVEDTWSELSGPGGCSVGDRAFERTRLHDWTIRKKRGVSGVLGPVSITVRGRGHARTVGGAENDGAGGAGRTGGANWSDPWPDRVNDFGN